MAAVLLGGPEAALSHRAAGAEWDIRSWSGKPEITVPSWRPGPAGVIVHTSTLPEDERTERNGIPITTVPRTLLDLATVLPPHQLLNAVNEAEEQELGDPLSLDALLDRHRGERGTAKLRNVLLDAGYGVARRELEELFARFIAERGLPRPELNGWVIVNGERYSPDCLWRRQRVIVELDSVRHHSTVPKLSRDATRDRLLVLAGWRVIHVTWAQLHDRREADRLAHDLQTLLRP
jgi:hypothetical protein